MGIKSPSPSNVHRKQRRGFRPLFAAPFSKTVLLLVVAQAYGLPDSYLSGGATRSRRSGRARPLRCARPTRSRCSVWLALPLPAYGLQRPLSFLVLRAQSPHRPSGRVLAAARFHRLYGLCLYRVPALYFSAAPPVAVLRSPRRVLRPRLAPVRGWSLAYAPTRALRLVSHSARALSPKGSWARLPPLTRRAVWSGLCPSPFFVGYRFELRAPRQGVSRWCSCPAFAPLPRGPIARQLKTFFIGYRLVLRAPHFASSGFALGCPSRGAMRTSPPSTQVKKP